jgi:hypothetical protein
MMGDVGSGEFKGLTPRIVSAIFQNIANANDSVEFTVKVSFMEVCVG